MIGNSSRGGECTSSIWPSAAPSTHPPRPSHYPTNRPLHGSQHPGGANAPLNMARPTYTIANYLCTWNLICFCAWPAQGGPSTAYCRGGRMHQLDLALRGSQHPPPTALTLPHQPPPPRLPAPAPTPPSTPPQPPAPPPHGIPHHPAQHPLHNPQHPPPTAPHTTPSTAPSAAPKADTTCHKIPAQKKFRGQIKKWNQGSVAPQQAPGPWGWSIP